MFDLFNVPLALLFTVLGFLFQNSLGILIGVAVTIVVAVLWFRYNYSRRPEWVVGKLFKAASDLEPVEDIYDRVHTALLRVRARVAAERES